MLYLAYYRIYLNIQIIVNEIKVEYIYIKKKKHSFLLVSPTTTVYRRWRWVDPQW